MGLLFFGLQCSTCLAAVFCFLCFLFWSLLRTAHLELSSCNFNISFSGLQSIRAWGLGGVLVRLNIASGIGEGTTSGVLGIFGIMAWKWETGWQRISCQVQQLWVRGVSLGSVYFFYSLFLLFLWGCSSVFRNLNFLSVTFVPVTLFPSPLPYVSCF